MNMSLKEFIECYDVFCKNDADGIVNDTNCRIAIQFYKDLLEIINER